MKKKEIEIVFITDAHLVYQNKFLGIDTFKAFESVIDEVESKYKNADFYIFGGDLIEDQKKESFDFFWSKLTTNSMIEKSLFTRGNHDIDKSFFDKLFTNQNTNLNCESWQLININTYSEGNIYGEVSDKQINLINEISKRYKNKNLMIYMHHNLFKTDSPWLDKYITRNHENLSVEISRRISSFATKSPTFFFHSKIVPSVIDSPNFGIITSTDIVSPFLIFHSFLDGL